MEYLPPDDILESLYKLRIRESEKLKTVLELYNREIHQKIAKPGYHRLKTMGKRSVEQNLRMLGNGRPADSVRKETSAVSGTMVISVQSQRHRLLLTQNVRQHKM